MIIFDDQKIRFDVSKLEKKKFLGQIKYEKMHRLYIFDIFFGRIIQ